MSDAPHYFKLTGVDCDGKRFVRTSPSLAYLRCINAWRGTMWEIKDGKTRKLWTIHN